MDHENEETLLWKAVPQRIDDMTRALMAASRASLSNGVWEWIRRTRRGDKAKGWGEEEESFVTPSESPEEEITERELHDCIIAQLEGTARILEEILVRPRMRAIDKGLLHSFNITDVMWRDFGWFCHWKTCLCPTKSFCD